MTDKLKKPACGAAAAKSKGKRNSGDCVQWTTQGQRDTCGMKHDPEKARVRDRLTGRRPPGQENQPTCFAFFNVIVSKGKPVIACIHWAFLSSNIGSHPSRNSHIAYFQSEGRPSARCVSDSSDIYLAEHWENYREVMVGSRGKATRERA